MLGAAVVWDAEAAFLRVFGLFSCIGLFYKVNLIILHFRKRLEEYKNTFIRG